MKPTLAPLAIVGLGARGGRCRGRGLAIVPILVTLPLFADYLTVARNMQGIPLTYSISNYSLIALAALPWVAEAARLAGPRPAGPTGGLSSPARTRLTGRSTGRARRDRGEGRGAQDRDDDERRPPARRRPARRWPRPARTTAPPSRPATVRAPVPVAHDDPGPGRERAASATG